MGDLTQTGIQGKKKGTSRLRELGRPKKTSTSREVKLQAVKKRTSQTPDKRK